MVVIGQRSDRQRKSRKKKMLYIHFDKMNEKIKWKVGEDYIYTTVIAQE